MKSSNPFQTPLCTIFLILIPTLISSQTCHKTCGTIPVKYPFGTGRGCGNPRFLPYVTCTGQRLTFSTHTGCYTVTSIDYTNQIIYISDPTMSTCSCIQPSRGFGLDWDAPFSFHDKTIVALLECSTELKENGSSTSLCDPQGSSICSLLYSCGEISRVSLPGSSCCVYTPVNLGPSFEMDLPKLQCSSYSALYGFNEAEYDPEVWNYGLALKYKFSFDNDYPVLCMSCEKSNGVCGYNDDESKSFACNCPGGLNTTTDCFYVGSWSHGSRFLPWKIAGLLSMSLWAWFFTILDFMGFGFTRTLVATQNEGRKEMEASKRNHPLKEYIKFIVIISQYFTPIRGFHLETPVVDN